MAKPARSFPTTSSSRNRAEVEFAPQHVVPLLAPRSAGLRPAAASLPNALERFRLRAGNEIGRVDHIGGTSSTSPTSSNSPTFIVVREDLPVRGERVGLSEIVPPPRSKPTTIIAWPCVSNHIGGTSSTSPTSSNSPTFIVAREGLPMPDERVGLSELVPPPRSKPTTIIAWPCVSNHFGGTSSTSPTSSNSPTFIVVREDLPVRGERVGLSEIVPPPRSKPTTIIAWPCVSNHIGGRVPRVPFHPIVPLSLWRVRTFS
jgi:hypothetical protein